MSNNTSQNNPNDPTYWCGTFTALGNVKLQSSISTADPLNYSALAQVQAECNALVVQLGFTVNGVPVNSVQPGAVHNYDTQAGYQAGTSSLVLNGFTNNNDFCSMYTQARLILNSLQNDASHYQ